MTNVRSALALAAAVLAVGWGLAAPRSARAAEGAEASLIEAISTAPADRPALRRALEQSQLRRLEAWRAEGVLKSYRLFFNRYADAGSWDALEDLTFASPAAAARWAQIERTAPAGLDPAAARLVTAISSAPADLSRHEGAAAGKPGPFLVIPYEVLVSVPDYLRYIDGYTIPQLKGWMTDGSLAGYELHLARYYAGRPWTALLVLQYRDEAALGRRGEVVAKVRRQLAADPAWKAISDNKKAVRAEKQAALADELGAGGLAP
jgi:hypothetical protein